MGKRQWGSARELRSGRWQAAFTGPDGRRFLAVSTFADERSARSWLGRMRDGIDLAARAREPWTVPNDVKVEGRSKRRASSAVAPEDAPSSSNTIEASPATSSSPATPQSVAQRTLRDYAQEWLTHADIRPTTRTRYERLLRRQILDVVIRHNRTGRKQSDTPAWEESREGLGDVVLADLNRAKVQAWWRSLPKAAGSDQPSRSAQQAFALLRTIMYAAMADQDEKDQVITSNPCANIAGAGKPSERRGLNGRTVTFATVLQLADAMPQDLRLAVLLAGQCALRSGEIRALRRSDIEIRNGVTLLHVQRSVVRAGRELSESAPKTRASVRRVPVPKEIVGDLSAHLEQWAEPGEHGLLFHRSDGQFVTDQRLRAAWLAACEQVGVTGLWLHDLRHVSLTAAAQRGATVAELMALAGHTTPTMALRYQEAEDDRLIRLMGA